MTALEQAACWIGQARRMVFLGGAGVSVPSGIPDFRSAGGIGGDFETILSHDYFMERPEAFYAFYRSHMVYPEAKPNLAHRTLAGWERAGLLRAVITQNIDGLHQAAVAEADLMLVAGTSLRVYPAAGLLQYMGRGRIVLINREPTAMDRLCGCVIHGELQDAFACLAQAVGGANHGGERNEA